MAEAGPSGEHQVAGAPNDDGNASFQASASMTQTTATEFSILLFNVSGANRDAGMPEAQREGIKRVLNSKELALDKFSTFIFCSDNVTNPKKKVFYCRLPESYQTKNEYAAIFHNKAAQTQFSPTHVHDVALLPLHLEHLKQKQEAKERIKKMNDYVTKWIEKKQTVGTQEELKVLQQRCEEAMSSLNRFPVRFFESTRQFREDCLGRVEVAYITCPHNDTQRGVRILLASWHGPHNRVTFETGKEYFQNIILFIEELRKYYEATVAVLGGDFNFEVGFARSHLPDLQDIKLFTLLNEELMYMVVWPASYLELRPDFPKIIRLNPRTVTVNNTRLKPFNHPVLLYRFAMKRPGTTERENRERGRER